MSVDDALAELERREGTHFDPESSERCFRVALRTSEPEVLLAPAS